MSRRPASALSPHCSIRLNDYEIVETLRRPLPDPRVFRGAIALGGSLAGAILLAGSIACAYQPFRFDVDSRRSTPPTQAG